MRYNNSGKLCTVKEPQNTLAERVKRIEDIRAIEECMHSYTLYADRFDPEGMASSFSENAILFWGIGDVPAAVGRDAIYRHFCSLMGRAYTQEHFCVGFELRFNSDGSVTGDCRMSSWQLMHGSPDSELFCYGHYEFTAILEDGEWRFSKLRLILNGKMQDGKLADGRCAEQLLRPWPPAKDD